MFFWQWIRGHREIIRWDILQEKINKIKEIPVASELQCLAPQRATAPETLVDNHSMYTRHENEAFVSNIGQRDQQQKVNLCEVPKFSPFFNSEAMKAAKKSMNSRKKIKKKYAKPKNQET